MRPPVDAERVRALARELAAVAREATTLEQDLLDVESMVSAELVDPARALELFAEVEPMLFRYPAINADVLRAKVELAFRR